VLVSAPPEKGAALRDIIESKLYANQPDSAKIDIDKLPVLVGFGLYRELANVVREDLCKEGASVKIEETMEFSYPPRYDAVREQLACPICDYSRLTTFDSHRMCPSCGVSFVRLRGRRVVAVGECPTDDARKTIREWFLQWRGYTSSLRSVVPLPTSLLEEVLDKMEQSPSPFFIFPLIVAMEDKNWLRMSHHFIEKVRRVILLLGDGAVSSMITALETAREYGVAGMLADLGNTRSLKPLTSKAMKDPLSIPFALDLCEKVGGPEAISFLRIVISAFEPHKWPKSLLKTKENRTRILISSEAKRVLQSIEGKKQVE
jgi:hypothetical protein